MKRGMEPAQALGLAVRNRRLRLGFSQEQLAERAGLHRTYIGSIERGERNVSLANITAIADALEVSASKLLAEAEKAQLR